MSLIKDAEKYAIQFFKENDCKINKAHSWDHTRRIVNNCKKILVCEKKADSEIVLVSAYLHDLGRADNDKAHAYFSWVRVKEILKDFKGLDKTKIEKILYIIRFHGDMFKDCPEEISNLLEFRILTDADKIDSFGPIGILRAPMDERFSGNFSKQIEHINDKSLESNYPIVTEGGNELAKKYREFLKHFHELYQEQDR